MTAKDKAMNCYWAIIIDAPESGGIIRYGYTFRDKNMREAKLHAMDVARQIDAVPLPMVWRISHQQHVNLYSPYCIPSPMFDSNEEA